MTAKKYLSELQVINTKIDQLQEQRQMYLDMATSITAPINPVKVQTNRISDLMGDKTSKAVDLGKKIDEEINNLWNKQQEVVKEIQSLHNVDYIRILFKVYVQFKTIKQASFEMKKSYSYTVELHKKALAAFEAAYSYILDV